MALSISESRSFSGSYSTVTVSAARLTEADAIPSRFSRDLSTAAVQAAQAMPDTLIRTLLFAAIKIPQDLIYLCRTIL